MTEQDDGERVSDDVLNVGQYRAELLGLNYQNVFGRRWYFDDEIHLLLGEAEECECGDTGRPQLLINMTGEPISREVQLEKLARDLIRHNAGDFSLSWQEFIERARKLVGK